MVHLGSITEEVRTLLNDNLVDVFSGTRAGSFVFGPDHEINYQKYMPKIQVVGGGTISKRDSFCTNWMRDKVYTVNVIFFTKFGDSGSDLTSGIKNKQLVSYYMEEIEKTIKTNMGSVSAAFAGFGDVDEPLFDADNSTYIGIKPIMFRKVEV